MLFLTGFTYDPVGNRLSSIDNSPLGKTNWRENNKIHLVRYAKWYLYFSVVYVIAFVVGIVLDIYWIVTCHYCWNTFNIRILFFSAVFDIGAAELIYCAFLAIIDLSPKQGSKDKTYQKEGHEE